MSTAGFSRVICFACVGAAFPELARAQSVLVRHSVVAEVAPVISVRDSAWSAPQEVDGGTQTTWSGEIRGNTVSVLQVMGARDLDQTLYARTVGGQWVRLTAGTWNAVLVTPAGRRVVTTMEVLVVAPSGTSPVRPAVRVVEMGATR